MVLRILGRQSEAFDNRSWRWQVLDGGMDMKTKLHRSPGKGATSPDRRCRG